MTTIDLTSLFCSGFLTEIDVHFAEFMTRLNGRKNRSMALAAALLSHATGNGHVCLDLKTAHNSVARTTDGEQPEIFCPETGDWEMKLRESSVVGRPGEKCPLILDDSQRLYLHRYWCYEQDLISAIQLRTERNAVASDRLHSAAIKGAFNRLFPGKHDGGPIDWQKVAVLVSLMKPFCVLSGGPGTGKTHTVAKILAMLIEQSETAGFRAALAAPTGKAAAKLGQSMKSAMKSLFCSSATKKRIPLDAQTIHRLLVPVPGTPYFHYNENNPLPIDVVIVDEASMIDLALLSKLATALPTHARLVLVGDKDQLASVEAGAVLGDICNHGQQTRFSAAFCDTSRRVIGTSIDNCGMESRSGIQDCIVNLVKSYRFDNQGGIGALSRAVNSGDTEKALKLIETNDDSSVKWQPVSTAQDLYQGLEAIIIQGYRHYLSDDDPSSALDRFGQFRILCAVNKGPWGVFTLNRLTENVLQENGLIQLKNIRNHAGWYAGRPILVTANDYNLGIFNGEIGLALPATDDDDAPLVVHFPSTDGHTRGIPAARLSGIETAFAMTIHKSQGSEFDQVHVILPATDSAVLTRELIYTAITRTRSKVTIWGQEQVLEKALSRRIIRRSGLREALWGRGADWSADNGSGF